MLIIGVAGMALVSVVYFPADNYLFFCIVRFLNGVMFGVASNTTITIVTSIIPKSRSGEGVGYFSLSQIVGLATGPLLALHFLGTGGMDSVFLFAVIMPCIATVLALLLKLPPQTRQNDGGGPAEEKTIDRYIERKILPIAALCFLLYACYSSILSFAAVYGEQIGLYKFAVFLFAAIAAVTIASRPFVSRIYDRKGMGSILYPGIVVLVSGFALISLSTQGWMLLTSGGLLGFGIGAVQTCTLAMVVRLVGRERLAVANSTYYISLDVATTFGPVIAGALATAFGFRGMYMIMAFAAACGILLYFIQNKRGVYGR
jgi:MFS family permease